MTGVEGLLPDLSAASARANGPATATITIATAITTIWDRIVFITHVLS
jgi:hypothetical protein